MIVDGMRINSLTDESNDCTFEKYTLIGESNVNRRGDDNNLDATALILSNVVLIVEPTMLTPTLVESINLLKLIKKFDVWRIPKREGFLTVFKKKLKINFKPLMKTGHQASLVDV